MMVFWEISGRWRWFLWKNRWEIWIFWSLFRRIFSPSHVKYCQSENITIRIDSQQCFTTRSSKSNNQNTTNCGFLISYEVIMISKNVSFVHTFESLVLEEMWWEIHSTTSESWMLKTAELIIGGKFFFRCSQVNIFPVIDPITSLVKSPQSNHPKNMQKDIT
jgi:hypothetical protein